MLYTALPFSRAMRCAARISSLNSPDPTTFASCTVSTSVPPYRHSPIRALAALKISDSGSWVSHHTAGLPCGRVGCRRRPTSTSPFPTPESALDPARSVRALVPGRDASREAVGRAALLDPLDTSSTLLRSASI